ncbi:MAG: CPBP family intramembrane metalloprotease [Planctomycetes bacterium]|nr:CPBP family intramembrane metalloprotease [Planctomycetota bacterium]
MTRAGATQAGATQAGATRAREWTALLLAMGFPSFMSWLEFWVLPGESTEPDPALTAIFVGGKVVQFSFPVLYVWLSCRDSFRALRWNPRGLGMAIAFSGLVTLGIFGLYFFVLKETGVFADTRTGIDHWLTKIGAASATGYILVAALISVPHSFLEEYYWRWFLFGQLQRVVPWGLAVAISSLAFMAHHVLVLGYYLPGRFWIAAVPFSLCVAGGAAVWAWLYHRTGSIYAPWLSHLIVDAAIMIVGYDMLFGF